MGDAAIGPVVYRALLSVARSLRHDKAKLRVRLPVRESEAQWGRGPRQFGFVPSRSAAREIFPMISAGVADDAELDHDQLRAIIRSEFRRGGGSAIEDGLTALKRLNAQVAMASSSSAVVTEQPETGAAVCVEATSDFVGRDGDLYVFSYRIRLSNVGTVPVQIIGRSWNIRNSDGSHHASVPRGSAGVVGQTPRLQPGGEAFEYASGTTFSTPGGEIEGALQMVSLPPGSEQSSFDATVGLFQCTLHADR